MAMSDADGSGDKPAAPVTPIGRRHFNEAFQHARRSVNIADLVKYDNFRRKFDPFYKLDGHGGDGFSMDWPDHDAMANKAMGLMGKEEDSDDDLYS